MTPPAASHAMLFLSAVSLGLPVRTDDGRLAVLVEPTGLQPVPAETLDWLESQGWIDLSGDEPRVTERGEYWLSRWARKHWRPKS